MAGFFGVLSSELSVFTLAVITMERNYAITHAMHLNKRLSLRHACYIMAAGWLFALVMAVLPLVGVSDYRKFAVCLPFEVASPASKGYVVFLMVINGVAFLILMGCYLKVSYGRLVYGPGAICRRFCHAHATESLKRRRLLFLHSKGHSTEFLKVEAPIDIPTFRQFLN